MTTSYRNGNPQGPPAERTMELEGGLSLDHYVQQSSQKLDAITNRFRRGEFLNPDSRDWMLDQVNFIVEAIGDESLELEEPLRSNLLQLLMAIANLNEQICRQASLSLPPR